MFFKFSLLIIIIIIFYYSSFISYTSFSSAGHHPRMYIFMYVCMYEWLKLVNSSHVYQSPCPSAALHPITIKGPRNSSRPPLPIATRTPAFYSRPLPRPLRLSIPFGGTNNVLYDGSLGLFAHDPINSAGDVKCNALRKAAVYIVYVLERSCIPSYTAA